MTARSLLVAAALAALLAAPPARAVTLSVEGFGGWQNLRLSRDSLGNAVSGTEGTGIVGGSLLLGFGLIGVGVLADKTVSASVEPWAGALLGGLIFPVAIVRLEALGELGRVSRSFDDLFSSSAQTFVGFRPGVNVRVPATPLTVGVSGMVRWPTTSGDFGSPSYGIVARIGFEAF